MKCRNGSEEGRRNKNEGERKLYQGQERGGDLERVREKEFDGGKGRERAEINASISSKASLGPLQRVCSHVCTLVCFCLVGTNTSQSQRVLR